MARKKPPPPPEVEPEPDADELAYLDDADLWESLETVFDEGLDDRAHSLTQLFSLLILAVETNQPARAVIACHEALNVCFRHTRECELSLQLWKRFHLTDSVKQPDEPLFLLEGALRRSGVTIPEGNED
jgi:hypothetical protein